MRLKRLILLVVALSAISNIACAKDCIKWPKVMAMWDLSQMKGEKVIFVHTFKNYTQRGSDEWLSVGLRDLLVDMLSTSQDLSVLSSLTAKYHIRGKNPHYSLSGMFQNLENSLRIFIRIKDGTTGELLAQHAITTPYPQHNDLFINIATTAKEILNFLKVKYKSSELENIKNLTASTFTYENYIKGMEALRTYKIDEIETAKIWFDQAKRVEFKSPLGYRGIVDMLTFLGFYHKQRGENFGRYFEQAEAELLTGNKITNQNNKGKKNPGKTENRFLLGNAAFKEGMILSEGKNWEKAAEAFLKSATYVPEDAVSWYHLSRIYKSLENDAAAKEALQKAYEINPCIEK